MSEKQEPKKAVKESKKPSKSKPPQKKKEEQLRKKLKQSEEEIRTLKDRLLRTAADLDNFRKRTEREHAQLVQSANRQLIQDILPIIDDMERSLKSVNGEDQDGRAFFEGVEMIYQKLLFTLKARGLEPMESVGQPFDVEHHEALLQLKKKGAPSDMVLEEHEKGYLLYGKVIRHAKVVVSK